MASRSLWIPLIWIVIIGSRPLSYWFGGGLQIEKPGDYLDGSPLDRNIFILLILLGLLMLWRHRIDWGKLFTSNRWLFAFFLYYCISLIWSDFPFVGFKRWFKDLGNVVMILIIVTDKNPAKATQAVFARYAYLAMPLSMLFMKYFPELGRYYNQWTWEPAFCGITTNKNELGCTTFICGLFLIWELIEMRTAGSRKMDKADLLGRAILLLTVIWVVVQAESSTARTCLILGTGFLLFMQFPFAKRQVGYLGTYTLVLSFLTFILYSVPGLLELLIELMGRDMTLTGRTDLWADLLSTPINPILGTGYKSFWLGPDAVLLWNKYSYHPIQAHNGYLETYLQGGLVGLSLLIIMIVSACGKLKEDLMHGDSFGILRFMFLTIAIFYNWTEAFFNAMSPLWCIVLLAALSYPGQAKATPENMPEQCLTPMGKPPPLAVRLAKALPFRRA
jgi:O-antigen ligase